MNHLDLFSGIGGFALAAQTVWGSDYHCVGFCEIDSFCQQVLRKNFEGVKIYGDIRGLTAEQLAGDSEGKSSNSVSSVSEWGSNGTGGIRDVRPFRIDLLTGGFPCQPFSTAGKRKGTQDDRFLWPEMLRVIREVKPRWVIGENVAGIIEMALGQVCADLEGLDYEVQPFVIPACAVNAPHRRDRVWIVGHANGCNGRGELPRCGWQGMELEQSDCPSSDTCCERLERCEETRDIGSRRETSEQRPGEHPESRIFPDWNRDWREVAFESCVRGVDDGLPRKVARLPDGSTISESKWRQEALKCYGNSIVPQVAMEIMRGIKAIDEEYAEIARKRIADME